MRLATGLMARGRLGSPEVLAAIGHAAEEAGMARVWFGDHVVYPVEYEPKYPSPTGRIGYNPAAPQLDVVVAMTWLCAATTRVGVGTSVMVVAERQPVWLAKQLASLDRLSGGRVSLGIGVGWCAEEYAALGVPFARRGARTDEYIRAMQTLWTEEQPAFDGEFVSFPPPLLQPETRSGRWDSALGRRFRVGCLRPCGALRNRLGCRQGGPGRSGVEYPGDSGSCRRSGSRSRRDRGDHPDLADRPCRTRRDAARVARRRCHRGVRAGSG